MPSLHQSDRPRAVVRRSCFATLRKQGSCPTGESLLLIAGTQWKEGLLGWGFLARQPLTYGYVRV